MRFEFRTRINSSIAVRERPFFAHKADRISTEICFYTLSSIGFTVNLDNVGMLAEFNLLFPDDDGGAEWCSIVQSLCIGDRHAYTPVRTGLPRSIQSVSFNKEMYIDRMSDCLNKDRQGRTSSSMADKHRVLRSTRIPPPVVKG